MSISGVNHPAAVIGLQTVSERKQGSQPELTSAVFPNQVN